MRALRSVYVYCVCCIGAWPGRCSCLSSGVSVCVCRSIQARLAKNGFFLPAFVTRLLTPRSRKSGYVVDQDSMVGAKKKLF